MADLILYVALAAAGYAAGARLQHRREKLQFVSGLQTLSILFLVFFMGARMGANEEIVSNLNMIGLYAFVLTIPVVALSVAAVCLLRHLMGIDRYGSLPGAEAADDDLLPQESESGGGSMTLFIVLTVGLGMLLGYTIIIQKNLVEFETLNHLAGLVIKTGLCVLLFLVGLDLGLEGTFVREIRAAGLRVFVIPFGVVAGTLAGSALASLVLPVSLGQALAVGSGFGWYSLAPVIIMEKGYMTASAISFMHNVMRELTALLLIPFVARKIGFVEATAMPGSGASDVCLPLIVRSTKGSIAIYSFVTGITVSLLVPILVPLFI
ncbi:MAG: lysine exporter LysO family protein [Emergencia sp.]